MMRVLFFGTPAFAVPTLRALVRRGHDVAAAVTQPERVRGRGMSSSVASPVTLAARALGVRVLMPETVRDQAFLDAVTGLAPEAHVVAAYGKIIPDPVLAAAPRGAWNVHPSLLPRWRGPAPIHRTIWAGDTETGVSIMRVTAEMDAGPVALQQAFPVGPRDTRGELEERLGLFGAEMMMETLEKAGAGEVTVTPQDDRKSTYAGMFKPEETGLKWHETAAALDRLVRALDPAPGAWFMAGGQRVKVRDVQPVPHDEGQKPGTLVERIPGFACRFACGSGSLWIGSVLPEGKSWMAADAFIQGKRLKIGNQIS